MQHEPRLDMNEGAKLGSVNYFVNVHSRVLSATHSCLLSKTSRT